MCTTHTHTHTHSHIYVITPIIIIIVIILERIFEIILIIICAMLVIKSGKRHLTDGMELPNWDKIRTLGEKEAYKYLSILEVYTIKQGDERKNWERVFLTLLQIDTKGVNIRLDTTEWVRWSTGRSVRNFNLTILTNSVCTTQYLS